jgi:hypothetical protein
MADNNPQKFWQPYYDNSRKKVKTELTGEVDEAQKKKEAELFLEVHTFEDAIEAVKTVGNIVDSSKTYTSAELEVLLNEVKDGKSQLDKVPTILREVLEKALVAEKAEKARLEYKQNLTNLFAGFNDLASADTFTEVFKSLKNDAGLSAKEKEAKLLADYNKLTLFCNIDGKSDPDNGNAALAEVQEISAKAMAMLEVFKAEAEAYILKSKSDQDAKEFERRNLQAENKAKGTENGETIGRVKETIKKGQETREEEAAAKKVRFEAKKNELVESKAAKEKEAGVSELVTRHEEIVKKIEELDICRKEYLEKDYDKTAALKRIGNFFSGNAGKKGAADDSYWSGQKISKNDSEILHFKQLYTDKLLELQTLILTDAQKRNLPDNELAQLYASFRIEQRMTLADEHDKVKADKITGTGHGWVKEGVMGMVEGYQQLNWKKKIIIAAGFAGVGALSATTGAVFATTVAGLIVARRIFGGLVTGVGVKQGLEVKGKGKDEKEIEQEQQAMIEKIKSMPPEDKYKLLLDRMNDIVETDGQDALGKIKSQDFRQNFTAAAAGIFVGSGWAGDLAKMGIHNIGDYFGWQGSSANIGANYDPNKIPEAVKPGGNGIPTVDAIEKSVAAPPEGITIVKGSSIEATLRDYYRVDSTMDHKVSGAEAHREFVNYMNDKITAMKTTLAEKPGDLKTAARLKEYQEMLKTGRATVHAGDQIFVDANGKLTDIQVDPKYGDIKMPHSVHHHVAPTWIEPFSSTEAELPSLNPEDSQPGFRTIGPEIQVDGTIDSQVSEGFRTIGPDVQLDSPIDSQTLENFEIKGPEIQIDSPTDSQMPEGFRAIGPEIYLNDASSGLSREALNNLVAGDKQIANPHLIRDLFNSGAPKEKILKTCLAEFTKGEGVNWREVKDVKMADLIQNKPGVRAGMRTLAANFRPLVGERLAGDRNFAFSDKVLNQTPTQWLAGVVSAASKNRAV